MNTEEVIANFAVQFVSSLKAIGGESLAYRLDLTWKLIDS